MSAGTAGVPARRGSAILLAATALFAVAAPSSAFGSTPPTSQRILERTDRFLAGLDRAEIPKRTTGGIGDAPPEPDTAGSRLLPDSLLVALYGAPQLTATAVGRRSAAGAARRLRNQVRPYRRKSDRPVVRSINLIGVIATATGGADGKYRTRQPDKIIRTYLKAARSVDARLTLDVQPGRSPVLKELKALRRWIAKPDVDVGIDPEWNVGRRGVPGRTEGSITHEELNDASKWLARLGRVEGLTQKALIVHQFRRSSIKGRRKIKQRPGVAITLNFDGIGSAGAKKAGYAGLASKRLYDGFSLFYERDIGLMRPGSVLRLRPEVDYVMYQ